MAAVLDGSKDDGEDGHPATPTQAKGLNPSSSSLRSAHEESDDDEDETEPQLKYTKLTGKIASVYRNGDSTSAFLVSGNKLLSGTHNGNIHVLSLPSLETIRHYHAHSASITDLSVSPFTSALSLETARNTSKISSERPITPSVASAKRVPTQASQRQPWQSSTASTSSPFYIATSSIDGHVCVSSLANHKDVTLRNFARPVQAVALSPAFQNDRTYISGGAAGSLILTTGGRQGVSSDANTNSAAAAASGWLGTMGLSTNSGKDVVLHSGEGKISTIRWSLTGKFVVWVNENGIKIMRSHLHHGVNDSDITWKRFGHISCPKRAGWDDIAGVSRARAQWINESCLETEDTENVTNILSEPGSPAPKKQSTPRKSKLERLLVGWADTIWIIHITSEDARAGRATPAGKASISHMFNFPDGIVSGVSLYTQSLLLTLVFRTKDDDGVPLSTTEENTPRRGIRRRQNGLPPDLRLIDLDDGNSEKEVESLPVSRHESLSSSDYHLSSLYIPESRSSTQNRNAFLTLGDGLWDIGANATKIFSSSASMLSGSSNDEKNSIAGTTSLSKPLPAIKSTTYGHPHLEPAGQKIFVVTPFDCILAVKTERADHFRWLIKQNEFDEAWNLLNLYPDIATSLSHVGDPFSDQNKKDQSSEVNDIQDDERSLRTTSSGERPEYTALEREKGRIGDLWIEHLISTKNWRSAGDIAGKLLEAPSRWNHWIRIFVENDKFDLIAFQMPTLPTKPPIPQELYTDVLTHYIHEDKLTMKKLLMRWHPAVFEVSKAILEIQSVHDIGKGSASLEKNEDWFLCQESLAILYVADGLPAKATQCYISTQNADAALSLIREHNLLSTIFDKIFEFSLLRVRSDEMSAIPESKLSQLTSEPISLLVSGALQDLIPVSTVIEQLEAHSGIGTLLLFFYFRALWNGTLPSNGDDSLSEVALTKRARFDHSASTNSRTRYLLAPYGDLAIDLFAQYDRILLSNFLRSSDSSKASIEDPGISYNYDHAVTICESRRYIPELVHLLAITGQTRRALNLIIGDLGDVAQAIAFVRDVSDDALWNDLMSFCLAKPDLIRGLLEHIDTDIGSKENGIHPQELIKRIPDDMAIPGLRDALTRLLRENEIQYSVAEGAAKVLRSEVAVVLNKLKQDRAKGVPFEVEITDTEDKTCGICKTEFTSTDNESVQENDALIGFACGHVFHLLCVLDAITTNDNKAQMDRTRRQLLQSYEDEKEVNDYAGRQFGHVGDKVTRMRMVSQMLKSRACFVCEREDVGMINCIDKDSNG